MSKVKVPLVSQSVTRSPIELLWTAKNIKSENKRQPSASISPLLSWSRARKASLKFSTSFAGGGNYYYQDLFNDLGRRTWIRFFLLHFSMSVDISTLNHKYLNKLLDLQIASMYRKDWMWAFYFLHWKPQNEKSENMKQR